MATDVAYASDYQQQKLPAVVQKLHKLIGAGNIAGDLDDSKLQGLGEKVVREFKIDDNSRADWKERAKDAISLAMQVAEAKNYPWPKASNVKYPLVTVAAIQFAARAYPAVVPPSNPVKVKLQGRITPEKQERADRIADHMSWQVLEEMPEWDEDTDKLLHILPIVGCVFRKTYFSRELGRNCSELVMPDKLCVNYWAKSLDRVPRITEEIELYPNEVEERKRSGTFLDVDLPMPTGEDDDAPMEFLEQHRRIDLDDDGYAEPYIVTVHKETAKVVRIVARFENSGITISEKGKLIRIEPVQYYTKYSFLPAPDGSFYDVGFGTLLMPINETVNASINQMLDAGHLQNVGGGLIANTLRVRGGTLRFKPGEYKMASVPAGMSMRDAVFDFRHPGPSAVLFNLLGLLLEAGKEIASIKDVLTGESAGANEPVGTTLAKIEQGLKVFTAIYKRVFRSMKDEYGKMARLNAIYLNPQTYFVLLDQQGEPRQGVAGPEDYDMSDLDVVPVADPGSVSDMQRIHRAQFIMQFLGDPAMNGMEIRRRVLEAANVDDVDGLFSKESPPPPPEVMKAMHEMQMDLAELDMKAQRQVAEIAEIESKIIKNLADAEGVEAGQQLDLYRTQMRELTERIKSIAQTEQGRVRGMADQSGNANGPAAPEAPGGPAAPAMGAGTGLDGAGPGAGGPAF